MQLAHYLGLLHAAEERLADSFREVAGAHREEVDVFHMCRRLAEQCDAHAECLAPFAARYGEDADAEPDRLHSAIFQSGRSGPLALLRDLQDLYLMASECDLAWTVVGQAAQGARPGAAGGRALVRSRDRGAAQMGAQPHQGSGTAGAGRGMTHVTVARRRR